MPPVDPVGSPVRVVELAIGTNTQTVKDRGCEILGGVRLGHRQTALSIGSPDDATGLDPSAREETGKDIAPVVTPRRENLTRGILSPHSDR